MTAPWRMTETTIELAVRRPRLGPTLVISSNIRLESRPCPAGADEPGRDVQVRSRCASVRAKRRRSLHSAAFSVNASGGPWTRVGAAPGEQERPREAEAPRFPPGRFATEQEGRLTPFGPLTYKPG